MDDGFIVAAGAFLLAMARRQELFHRTILCIGEESHVDGFTHAVMNTHRKSGRRNHHEGGQKERCDDSDDFHLIFKYSDFARNSVLHFNGNSLHNFGFCDASPAMAQRGYVRRNPYWVVKRSSSARASAFPEVDCLGGEMRPAFIMDSRVN